MVLNLCANTVFYGSLSTRSGDVRDKISETKRLEEMYVYIRANATQIIMYARNLNAFIPVVVLHILLSYTCICITSVDGNGTIFRSENTDDDGV